MPAPTRVRALAVGCAHLVAFAFDIPFRQDSRPPSQTANCELLVVICIHMAGCSYATRLRVAVVMGATGPLLGRFGLWRSRSASIPQLFRLDVASSQLLLAVRSWG
jgi:hypothetical protein